MGTVQAAPRSSLVRLQLLGELKAPTSPVSDQELEACRRQIALDMGRGVAVAGYTASKDENSMIANLLRCAAGNGVSYVQGFHLIALYLCKHDVVAMAEELLWSLGDVFAAVSICTKHTDQLLIGTTLGNHFEELGLFSSSYWGCKMMFLLFIDVLEDELALELMVDIIGASRLTRRPVDPNRLASLMGDKLLQVLRLYEDQLMAMTSFENVIALLYMKVPLCAPPLPSLKVMDVDDASKLFDDTMDGSTASFTSECDLSGLDDTCFSESSAEDAIQGGGFYMAHSTQSPVEVKEALELEEFENLCAGFWCMALRSCVFFFWARNPNVAKQLLEKVDAQVLPVAEWSKWVGLHRNVCKDHGYEMSIRKSATKDIIPLSTNLLPERLPVLIPGGLVPTEHSKLIVEAAQTPLAQGTVKAWTEDRGTGLIAPGDGSADLLVFRSMLVHGQSLVVGANVSYYVYFTPRWDAQKNKATAGTVQGASAASGVGQKGSVSPPQQLFGKGSQAVAGRVKNPLGPLQSPTAVRCQKLKQRRTVTKSKGLSSLAVVTKGVVSSKKEAAKSSKAKRQSKWESAAPLDLTGKASATRLATTKIVPSAKKTPVKKTKPGERARLKAIVKTQAKAGAKASTTGKLKAGAKKA